MIVWLYQYFLLPQQYHNNEILQDAGKPTVGKPLIIATLIKPKYCLR